MSRTALGLCLLALVVAGANGQSYTLVPGGEPYNTCDGPEPSHWSGTLVVDVAWACANGYSYFSLYQNAVNMLIYYKTCDSFADGDAKVSFGGPQMIHVRALPAAARFSTAKPRPFDLTCMRSFGCAPDYV